MQEEKQTNAPDQPEAVTPQEAISSGAEEKPVAAESAVAAFREARRFQIQGLFPRSGPIEYHSTYRRRASELMNEAKHKD